MDRADIYKEDSEGSAEKLLGEASLEDTEETDVVSDDEEDDIAKLMGFNDNGSDNEQLEKKPRTVRHVSKTSIEASPTEETDGNDKLKTVRIESVPEEINISLPVTSKRNPPTSVLKRQAKMMKMYEKHNSQTSKLVCGILCIFIILGIGVVLLFLARTKGMKDLYIIGGIFTTGGILFTISFIILRCTVDKRNAETDYSGLFKSPVE